MPPGVKNGEECRLQELSALMRCRWSGDRAESFLAITRGVARGLEADRVGIWQIEEGSAALVCRSCCDGTEDRHHGGVRLSGAVSGFFQALEVGEPFAVGEARTDPRTRELASDYLEPLGIVSLLQVPVVTPDGGRWILSAEQLGEAREWNASEQLFVVAAAGLLAQAVSIRGKEEEGETVGGNDALVQLAARLGKLGGWSVDVRDQSYAWSEEAREIHGVDPEACPSAEEIFALYLPEYRERIRKLFWVCANEGISYDEEVRLRSVNGQEIWVRVVGQPVRDEEGKIFRVEGAVQNISERKEIEISLAASEVRIRQLVDAMPMIVWMATPEGTIDYFNRHFASYTGLDLEANVTDGWQPFIHPDDLLRFMKIRDEAMQTEKPFASEIRVRTADGVFRWFQVQAVPVRDLEGELIKWYGTAIDVHGTKKLQEEAVVLARRLKTTLESITDGFFTLDREWRFTYVNAEAERLLECSREELLGVNIWDAYPWAQETEFYSQYQRAVADNVSVAFEEYGPSVEKWVEVNAYPSVEGLTVYLRDVTERKRDREKMQVSEERFRLLSRASNEAIWDLDLADGAIWWNDEFTALFGYERESLQVLNFDIWSDLVHPEERQGVVDEVLRALAEKEEVWSAEYRLRRKDGTYANVLDRGYIIRDSEGKSIRMIGGIGDLTERRRTEAKILEQAELLDKAQDAIIVRDLNHRVLYWNKSAERVYGWTPEEAKNIDVHELIYDDTAAFNEAVKETLSEGEWTGEMRQFSKSGEVLTVEARWTLVLDEKDVPKSILAINTDVTQSKKLQAQFLRIQRMESIGTLAGGIAHDLNNILSPILMGIEYLKEEETDEQRLRMFTTLLGSARRGVDMVKQVLSFASGVGGRREVFNVADMVRDVKEILEDTFPKNVETRICAPQCLWPVEADPTQIHQVIMNLCINARDAMPGGGILTISMENRIFDGVSCAVNPGSKPGPYILVEVDDTGTGIVPSVQDKIFDPFFTTKEFGKGTGLGLSTVLTIVRGHGGFVSVDSERGKGTRFEIYLPVENAGNAVVPKARPVPRLPRGNGEVVLVIDDEEAILNVTKRTLERFGYAVLLATNGAEGVAIYARKMNEIAVVLTDMTMPIMDGSATIIALRSINPEVKIIACSGFAASYGPGDPATSGICQFVAKPYSSDVLLNTLQKALQSKGE